MNCLVLGWATIARYAIMRAARPTRTGCHVDPPSQRRPAGVEELVHPHGQDQDRHHHREARVRPAGREDPADDQPGVGQALRRKKIQVNVTNVKTAICLASRGTRSW